MPADIRKYLVESSDKMKSVKSTKKAVVTEIREKTLGRVNPVIINFQNGDLNEDQASEFNVFLTPKIDGKTNVEVEASYGHVFKEVQRDENAKGIQVIAIRNRKTNKVKLIEVDNALLINSALLHSSTTTETSTDFMKDFKTLNKIFGGKKIVQKLEQKDKLNINKMLVAEEIKDSVANLKVETILSVRNTETDSINNLLPYCNRKAKHVSEVYHLNEILTEGELELLKEEISAIKKLTSDDYSNFFLYCYEEAKKSDENINDRLAGILFAESLIKFLKTPIKKLTSKTVDFCPYSTLIHTKILNEFCIRTDSSLTRPLTMRDKTLCYIIVLTLICCNYQINLKLLATVVSVHLVKLNRLARVVGAIPLSKDEHMFVLRLPLPALPKASVGKARTK